MPDVLHSAWVLHLWCLIAVLPCGPGVFFVCWPHEPDGAAELVSLQEEGCDKKTLWQKRSGGPSVGFFMFLSTAVCSALPSQVALGCNVKGTEKTNLPESERSRRNPVWPKGSLASPHCNPLHFCLPTLAYPSGPVAPDDKPQPSEVPPAASGTCMEASLPERAPRCLCALPPHP